ncbi:MAG: ATP-binding protein, partial [Thermoanaerobaculia bacterium]
MPDFEKLGSFYLGRPYDLGARKAEPGVMLYDSKDLTTHAVIVGMTGSGKTGLGIGLIEEAVLDRIPVLAIDPKGDLPNLLLTFPDLAPEDFEPWVNEDDARRQGLSRGDWARSQAELWRRGLAEWGQDGERIRRLRASAGFTVYTPGSTAGVPLAILDSFKAPTAALLADDELLADRVATTAGSLLSLLGFAADPLRSRDHILLATLLDHAWRERRDLDLATLIQLIQRPPIRQVGVLDVETFYPEKERFGLAMAINNLLAAPGFDVWLRGEPLDIGRLLHDGAGRPQVAIVSIAHLAEAERMFFLALLLGQVVGWVRQQAGTTSLRALLYMDELFGYLPPVGEPPTKKPLLTLLKQARAHGVGLVLATQNPVDLDYKALSNAGTWFVGRLQTDRDKQRLLDGLEGAAAGGRAFDRRALEATLAGLESRVFLLHDVREDAPTLFETRWVMSYLAGPLTRDQIRRLSPQRPAADRAASPSAAPTR